MSRIHLSAPDVRGREEQYVLEAIRSNWVAPLGPDLDQFEREIAARCGVSFAVGLSSGTAALHLALVTAGIGSGDVVLVPTLTFVPTANVVRYVGAEPVFIRKASRRLRRCGGAFVQREQDHHDERWRHAVNQQRRGCRSRSQARYASQGASPPLRAHRGRIQLPALQYSCSFRKSPTRDPR